MQNPTGKINPYTAVAKYSLVYYDFMIQIYTCRYDHLHCR